MSQYTLLLVDDEEEVIQMIMQKLPWTELGFSVIGHANNGVKALEMMEEYQPDVVMSDIHMPYMDGLELCSHIKQDYPSTHVLLFTGFDEFEYAREAVHLEVDEYVLKPLNASELSNVFVKLKEKIDQEISEKKNIEVLQTYYLNSLPLLQANFYSFLIEGRIQEDELFKYLDNYQISFDGSLFCCLVVHTSSNQVPTDMDARFLTISVDKQVREQLAGKWNSKCFTYLDNTILIAQLSNENELLELTDDCDRFCKYMHRVIGAEVTIGVGQLCYTVLDLSQSYCSAKEAVSYRVLYGGGCAINLGEIIPQKKENTVGSDAELSNMLKMISLGSGDAITDAVDEYVDKIYLTSQSLQEHKVTVMELVSALYHFMLNNDIRSENGIQEIVEEYPRLINMERDHLKQWLSSYCAHLHEKMNTARDSSTQSLIRKAKDYVHMHYQDENLSLDDICEALSISNSYFSSVFKKETGNSFIGYLTEFRMEKAARLLVQTNEKSYYIAKSVGYSDPNYFSYVFKRQYGVSPSKYRSEYAEEK